ncbi:RNA-binding protein [Candidatus Pacearchaeota archaeon CG_4_10_14_0_2_um_filter_31_10]|nr:MAG: RNA-binding protein [Candidatus Pacearchaeota archaeon CG10_big_fil_rev_8_21_14_0_10_31_59]PIZ80739.1 MAG: RNA-binding protein [Candidatus Pacearchaeota archaeon CG_4_10_14_0_2_um_filter_31_10]
MIKKEKEPITQEDSNEITSSDGKIENSKRDIVVPGEIIAKGEDFLPGEGTIRDGEEIVAVRYGLLDKSERLLKIIPMKGVYIPRKGNTIIGMVTDITLNGWFVDINSPYNSFLTIKECSAYVPRGRDLSDYYKVGDFLTAKVLALRGKVYDLTMKESKSLHKISDGLIIVVNPHAVPRIIGRGGSMIGMIKEETETNITVGQNGLIWIKGKEDDMEILAKDAIEFIAKKPFVDGLTESVKEFLEKRKNK